MIEQLTKIKEEELERLNTCFQTIVSSFNSTGPELFTTILKQLRFTDISYSHRNGSLIDEGVSTYEEFIIQVQYKEQIFNLGTTRMPNDLNGIVVEPNFEMNNAIDNDYLIIAICTFEEAVGIDFGEKLNAFWSGFIRKSTLHKEFILTMNHFIQAYFQYKADDWTGFLGANYQVELEDFSKEANNNGWISPVIKITKPNVEGFLFIPIHDEDAEIVSIIEFN